MFENTSKIFKTLKKYGRTGWFLITLFASKIIFASYFSKNFCRFSNQKLSERIIFSSRWKIKVIFQITACLQLNFRPRVNSILCVVKVLIVFKTKKLKKKNIPRGELTPPALTAVIFSPRGKTDVNWLVHTFFWLAVGWLAAELLHFHRFF